LYFSSSINKFVLLHCIMRWNSVSAFAGFYILAFTNKSLPFIKLFGWFRESVSSTFCFHFIISFFLGSNSSFLFSFVFHKQFSVVLNSFLLWSSFVQLIFLYFWGVFFYNILLIFYKIIVLSLFEYSPFSVSSLGTILSLIFDILNLYHPQTSSVFHSFSTS
jgi:hypothetical protein